MTRSFSRDHRGDRRDGKAFFKNTNINNCRGKVILLMKPKFSRIV